MTELADNHNVEWTIHPIRRNLFQALLVSIIVIGVAYSLALLTGSGEWTLLYLGIFMLSLHRYFFPTNYSVSRDGITVRRPWRQYEYALEEYRSFTVAENGIQLNRMNRDTMYDRIRGVFIMTDGKKEEVADILSTQLGKTE